MKHVQTHRWPRFREEPLSGVGESVGASLQTAMRHAVAIGFLRDLFQRNAATWTNKNGFKKNLKRNAKAGMAGGVIVEELPDGFEFLFLFLPS